MSSKESMSPAEWSNYKKLWRLGPRGVEDDWSEYAMFAANQFGGSASNTGVVWAGENHGCPCRLLSRSSAEARREAIGVCRHPERPDRLQKIIEAWQKNTYLSFSILFKLVFFVMFVDFRVVKLQGRN